MIRTLHRTHNWAAAMAAGALLAACAPQENGGAGVAASTQTAPGEATPAAASPAPYVGRWAEDIEWCANTAATTDQIALEITQSQWRGYEGVCEIEALRRDGDVRYEFDLACVGEGQSWEVTRIVDVYGDEAGFTFPGSEYLEMRNRCPE